MATTNITNDQVFAYAEANFSSIFAGSAIAGVYLQYTYRYYPASGNYLGIDAAGEIFILGPYSNYALLGAGPVASIADIITAWETSMGMGAISVAGEIDSVPHTMVAGHAYRIEVQATAGSLLNPEIVRVLDPSQSTIPNAFNADYGISQNAQLTLAPTVDGAYSIGVQGQNGTTGRYIVTVTDLNAASTGNGAQATIAAGQTYSDTVSQSFQTKTVFFSLTGDQEYQFILQAASSGNVLNTPVLQGIYDETGKQLAGSYGQASGGTLSMNVTPAATGVYYAVIADSYDDTGGFNFAFNAVAAAKAGTTYAMEIVTVAPMEIATVGAISTATVGTISTATLDDYAATTSTTGSVISGGSTTGSIETSGDEDWCRISLSAGTQYSISLEGADTNAGTLSDPYIAGVYNSAGTVISGTSNDDGGVGYNSLVTYTPTTTGTYYIAAGAYRGTGTYTLSVTASDDYAATTSTTGSVTSGSSTTGNIESNGDNDCIAAYLYSGYTYQFNLRGASSSSGTLADPVIDGVYDASGTYVSGTYADNGGTGYDSLVNFAPTSTGYYYLLARSYANTGTGTYTLSVSGTSTAEGDSVAGNTTTTATVAAGGSVTGTIGSATDADWFAVSLAAGYIYTVQLQGSTSGNGTLDDPLISGIYNSGGGYVSNTYADDQNGSDSSLSFAPAASGTYYIAAEGYGSSTGTFLLSVQQTSADVAGSTSTASSVAVGGSASVTIDQAYDHDWYAVSLTGGNTYQFTLSGAGAYPIIYGIHDTAGSYIEGYATGVTSGSATTATATFTPAASATYYVDAYSYHAGGYTLSVTQTATNIAANTGTSGTVSAGGSVAGTIDSATDADWYAVSLTAGNTYTIQLQGSTSGNGTLSDPLISGIHDSGGAYIPNTYADDQNGRDSSLIFTPAASGTYYVAAEGYGSSTGTFLLSVSQAATNDIAASTATTGAVSAGSYVNGAIDSAADADWYAVSLTASNAYTIRLQGGGSSNGTLGDPLISGIYDAGGALVSNTYADDQDGSDSRLSFTPTASGTYYVAAEGYGSSTGTFRLSVEQQASADLAASVTTTGIVLANSSVTGAIDAVSDQDWFSVSLNADTRYQVDLQGLPSGSGTLADPYLHGIYDSSGTFISGTTDDDSGQGYDSRVTLDIGSAGTYYVAAGAYGSNTGTYTLAVTGQGSTDIPADRSTSATVTPGSSVDGLVGEADDRDWFAVSLVAAQSYTIDLQPKTNSTAPLLDPYLYGLHDSAGGLIPGTTDDDTGAGYGAQITYTPAASGTYYVSAGGYGSNTGSYVLSVSSGASGNSGGIPATTTDLAATTATLGAVSAGASATSLIDAAADQDWFRVSLSAGRSYDIGLGGSASDNGTLTDPYLGGIYDSAGTLISGTTDDDSGYGNDALVSFTPTSTGAYYISAGAFASATGSYTLTVSENATVNTGSTTVTPGTQGNWTIMVYVDGDNNLEGAALTDINEMEAASLPQNVRVSTLVDRTSGYSSADGNWTDSRFGLIGGDSNLNHISSNLTSWGERNMGDPATLTEFINASALAAPADNYALVIWNHGGGISGVAWDDSSYSANLSLNEVSQAIAASNVTRFGMIGFDTCLQGVLDQAYVLRNQAGYLVVSEDTEPGDGWDYTNWLSVFQQPDSSARQVATQAVNSYENFYQAQGNNTVTLSVIDTAQISGVATAWSSFAQALNTAGSGAMQTLQSARNSALDFENTYVDLHSLMSNFMQLNAEASLDTAAQNVLAALSVTVLETGGLATARGLTVYLPGSNPGDYLNANEYPIAGLTGIDSFYTAYWA